MGLDMYLDRKVYVKNWKHDNNKYSVLVKKNDVIYDQVDPDKVVYIEEQVGYWRKANAVHQWFVINVQDGEDDCKPYYVTKEKLRELWDAVNKVLLASKLVNGKIVDTSMADELLPPQEGFFFGNTDYDEWYLENLRDTREILKPIIERTNDEGEYFYQSSW